MRACNGCALPIPHGRYCKRCAPLPRLRGRAGQRQRQAALARAGNRCEDCGSERQLQVDHVVALGYGHGGTHDPNNLRVRCKDCHDAKTLQERLR